MIKWFVASGCAVGQAVSNGPLMFNVFGLFLIPMTSELGWTRTQFSNGVSATILAVALILPYVGYWIDRIGSKRVIWLAVFTFPASFACFGLVHSYWAFLVLTFISGLIGALTTPPVYVALLPQWFDRRLGFALALAGSGTGLGILTLAPVASHLIAGLGWRHAIFALSLLAALIGALNAGFMVRPNRGPVSEDEKRPQNTRSASDSGASFGEAVRTAAFWSFSIGFTLVVFVILGVNIHFAAILSDRGYTPTGAAAVISLVGVSAIASGFVSGILLDRIPLRFAVLLFMGGQALGAILLWSGAGGIVPFLAALLLGSAQGSVGNFLSFSLSRRFGRKAYGKIYASAFAIFNVGALFGPPMLGAAYDHFGSYEVPLAILPLFSITAIILSFLTRVEPVIQEAIA